MYIEDDGFSNAYKKMCLYLLKNGEKSCPRNMGTQEVEGAMIRVKNPRTRMINHELRNVSISFAIGEWLWHMEGRNDLKMIQYYAPSYYKYSDDGKTLNGAYGPRIKKSLTKIVETLKKDPDSRRAVVPIYGKEDAGLDSNDIPCTIGFQFLIRNNKLDMIVNMRKCFKTLINFIGAMTLEIYLTQYIIYYIYKDRMIFPVNFIVVSVSIIILSCLVHYLDKLLFDKIRQRLRKRQDYE